MCWFFKFWWKYCWCSLSLNFMHENKVTQNIWFIYIRTLFCTKSSLVCENVSLRRIIRMVCLYWLLSHSPMLNRHNLSTCEYRHSIMTINFPYLFFEILFSVHLMWSLHERFSSNNTPWNLIDEILSIFQLFIWSLGNFSDMSPFLLVLWKNEYFVFVTLRESLLARNHSLVGFT